MPALTRLQIHCFRYPLARPLSTVFGRVDSRPALILRVEDADGGYGYGEIWCNFPSPAAEYRARLAEAVLPGALAGLSSDAPEAVFAAVRRRLHPLALQAGENGPADQIAAGVDIAVHDLAARRMGVPLATHLGGSPRRLRPYASGIGPPDAEHLIETSRSAGFDAFKLRISPVRDQVLAAIARARETIGLDVLLMVDANQSWNLDEAEVMAAALAGFSLAWLEEPLPADRPESEWAQLSQHSSIPLAAGENMRDWSVFTDAIAAGHLAVIQPDICKWGGLSECAPLARAILSAGRRYCPHYLGGGVGLAASAHLLAAVGGDGLLEVDVNDNALREALAGPLLPLRDGRVHVPDRPGLGYEPDLAALSDLQTAYFDRTIAP